MASPITVGLICPTSVEFKSCCHGLRLKRGMDVADLAFGSRKADHIQRYALCSGPGKMAGASAAQILIDHFHPDIIVDVGAAGSLVDRIGIGTIIGGVKAFEYDEVPIEELSDRARELASSTLLDGMTETTNENLLRFAEWVREKTSVPFTFGHIASGDVVVNDPDLRKQLHECFGALACTWETAAVLKTAARNKIQAMSFRAVTDTASGHVALEFAVNHRKVLVTLFIVLEEFLSGGWLAQIKP